MKKTDGRQFVSSKVNDTPVGKYPGVVYDYERDVMAEGKSDVTDKFESVVAPPDNYVPAIDNQALRAAALQAASQIATPDTPLSVLLLNAAAVEAYLKDGTAPSGLVGT